METNEQIKSILSELGYPIIDCGNYFKTKGLYRDGQDNNSLTIYWKDDTVLDHVLGEVFDIETLIKKTLKFEKPEQVKDYLKNKNYSLPVFNPNSEPVIKQIKKFSGEIVNKLLPEYDYWLNRGIDINVLKETKGGLYKADGQLKDRFIFPIYNSKNQVVAFNARDITNKKKIKWKFLNSKEVVYPAFINSKLILEKKEVYLVESIGDYLALATCGIKNVLVLFGIYANNSIINFLLRV